MKSSNKHSTNLIFDIIKYYLKSGDNPFISLIHIHTKRIIKHFKSKYVARGGKEC